MLARLAQYRAQHNRRRCQQKINKFLSADYFCSCRSRACVRRSPNEARARDRSKDNCSHTWWAAMKYKFCSYLRCRWYVVHVISEILKYKIHILYARANMNFRAVAARHFRWGIFAILESLLSFGSNNKVFSDSVTSDSPSSVVPILLSIQKLLIHFVPSHIFVGELVCIVAASRKLISSF